MNTVNSKANEPHTKTGFKNVKCWSLKSIDLLHLKKYKAIPMWNDEFVFSGGSYSVSDIQDYIACIIWKHETLPTNPAIRICINRINKRPDFNIKDGYKLELQTPETMKLFGSTKNKEWRKCTKSWSGWRSFGIMQFSRKSISIKFGGIIYFYAK